MTSYSDNCLAQDVFVLTLDGPSGSGKGTLGQMLAKAYQWHYLDSGAVYRAFAYMADKQGIKANDDTKIRQLYEGLNIQFSPSKDGGSQIYVDGDDLTVALRSESTAKLASNYATKAYVREILLQLQWSFAKAPGLVADGRDMGSVVFPNATLKIFLTASAICRANRRFKQLKSQGFDVNLTRLVEEIKKRDLQDENRPISPLKPADDAIVVDSSDLSSMQVFQRLKLEIDKKVAELSQ